MVSETIPALLKLKEKGLVRHIGITGLPLKVFPYVIDRYRRGAQQVVGWPRMHVDSQPTPLLSSACMSCTPCGGGSSSRR